MIQSKLILVGKAASGKDYLKNKLIEKGFEREISYTTRPPRSTEVNGKDYYFLDDETFLELKNKGFFYECVKFNNWYYGTSNEQFDKGQVFIFNPSGIKHITVEDRKKCFIIYIDIPYETRKSRLMLRSDVDTVERRLAADEQDFENFTDYDMRITNPNF